MKLPFKIPSIKVPKLPKIKLPKFGKKKAGDDDEDENFEDFEGLGDSDDADGADDAVGADDKPPPEPAAEDAAAPDSEDSADADGAEEIEEMPDFGDDEDEEDGEGGGASKKKRLMIIGGGALAALLIIGGGAWYFMSGDDAEETNARAGIDPDVPRVEIAIAPKRRASTGGSLNAIAAGATGPGSGVVVAAVSDSAFASFTDPATTDAALAVANDPSLIEQGVQGPLPRIAEDGRKPWQVYAKPFTAAGESRIGLIVAGLGLSRSATEAAIRLLPGSVTLAFDPYAEGLADWAAKARQAGHELLLMVPLESANFPYKDAGPQALTTTNDPAENRFRLEFVLSRMSGYVGVLTVMGSKFTQSDEHMRAFFNEINDRGLILVEGKREDMTMTTALAAEIGLPRASVDVVLDEIPGKPSIDRNFGEVEDIITDSGIGVAVAEPYPVSLERIIAWSAALKDKKVDLAPITSIVGRQPVK